MTRQKKGINETIGANIQAVRDRAGLTQAQLSEAICIGDKSLSAIERGCTGVSLSTLKKTCEVLSITADSLIFGASAFESERDTEIQGLVSTLNRLTPSQYEIVKNILINVFAAFNQHNTVDG